MALKIGREIMELSTQSREILRLFIEHQENYITAKEISEFIGYSDRTVRKYIAELSSEIPSNIATIHAIRGKGYTLTINNTIAFNKLVYKEINKSIAGPIANIQDCKQRIGYIINQLLFEKKDISVIDLMDQLYVSEATINKDLGEIRNLIKPYQLTLKRISNMRIKLIGEERNKRRFIMNNLFSKQSNSNLASSLSDLLSDDTRVDQLTLIVLDECHKEYLEVSDFVVNNLVLHIRLAIERISLGYTIDNLNSTTFHNNFVTEQKVAKQIIHRIEKMMDIQFPPDEVGYVALHLQGKKTNQTRYKQEKNQVIEKEKIKQLFYDIQVETGLEISIDSLLINGISAHLEVLMNRLNNGIHLSNPLLTDVLNTYSTFFEMTKKYFKELTVLQDYEISDHEWAYLTLHIVAAHERFINQHKLKVLVVCATGYGSAQVLKNRLENEFGNSLIIAEVLSYYDLNRKNLRDIDLIISSIALTNIVLSVPVVHVSVFLEDADVKKIRQVIKNQSGHFYTPKSQKNKKLKKETWSEEVFHQYFSKDRFIVFNKWMNKEEILETLITSLDEKTDENFMAEFKQELELRESFSPVVFSENLAFPHPANPIGLKGQFAIGYCTNGVEWDEEHPDIKLVVLMSPSKLKNNGLRSITNALVELMHDEKALNKFLQKPDFICFKEILVPHIEEDI